MSYNLKFPNKIEYNEKQFYLVLYSFKDKQKNFETNIISKKFMPNAIAAFEINE